MMIAQPFLFVADNDRPSLGHVSLGSSKAQASCRRLLRTPLLTNCAQAAHAAGSADSCCCSGDKSSGKPRLLPPSQWLVADSFSDLRGPVCRLPRARRPYDARARELAVDDDDAPHCCECWGLLLLPSSGRERAKFLDGDDSTRSDSGLGA